MQSSVFLQWPNPALCIQDGQSRMQVTAVCMSVWLSQPQHPDPARASDPTTCCTISRSVARHIAGGFQMLGSTKGRPVRRQTNIDPTRIFRQGCEKNTQYMHLAPPPSARTSRYQYGQLQGMGTPIRLTGASTNTTLSVCVCYLCLYLNLMSVCVVCQSSVAVQLILCKQHVQAETEIEIDIKGYYCTVQYSYRCQDASSEWAHAVINWRQRDCG